jgi:hypothetical protein
VEPHRVYFFFSTEFSASRITFRLGVPTPKTKLTLPKQL